MVKNLILLKSNFFSDFISAKNWDFDIAEDFL